MRTRLSLAARMLCALVMSGLVLSIGAHASAEPVAPMSDASQQITGLPTDAAQQVVNQPADVGSQILVPMKKAKKPPKWACSRIYIEGKPLRPTVVKLWCNQGKTLIHLKTPGLKPGTKASHSSVRNFHIKKGKYYNFTVVFRKLGNKADLRAFYMYGKNGTFHGVARMMPGTTPQQSRIL